MGKENGAYTNNEILSILKREGNSSVTTWTNLEDIMPSEISQTQKEKYCMILLHAEPKKGWIHRSRKWIGGYQVGKIGRCWLKGTKLQSCRIIKSGKLMYNVMTIASNTV